MSPSHTTGAFRRLATLRHGVLALVTAAAFAWTATAAHAAPPAGTSIGNQASATYLDASGTSRSVPSNLVTTIVLQVASFTLTADGTLPSAPGGSAVFPHVLTNTGNGTDDFNLTAADLGGDNFDFASIQILPDADGNGVPDNFTPIASTGPIAAGAVFHFVVVAAVPGTQVGGDFAQLRITATSVFDNAQTAFNTDRVNVTGNAVVAVTKGINVPSGNSPSGPYTYTMTYTNSGNATATGVRFTDVVPVGMTYVPGSGRWSATGAVVLTDADSTDAQGVSPNTVQWIYDGPSRTVTAILNQVPAGSSGTITFGVNVDPGLAPQVLNNSSRYAYFDGAANAGPFFTNQAPFTVLQSVAFTFTGTTIDSVNQGAALSYANTLVNNGNGTDRFDVTIGVSTFPPGTTYALYQADGVTPLTDTNFNGTPDTGPVAAGATTTVVLRVQLPPNATGGGFQVQKTATSITNGTNATATDILNGIRPNRVDLTNNAAFPGGLGVGAGPEAGAVVTNATNPGTTTRFTLYVNNTAGVADAYNLAASTDGSFGALTLPAGWSVQFLDATLTPIAGTVAVGPWSGVLVYADVTVPAAATPGTTDVYFRSLSPTTGAADRIHDAVTVNPLRQLTLVPNNNAQIVPGGTVVYTHLLFNNGNVVEGDGTGSLVALTTADNQAGWSSVIYHDTNNSGVFDAGDVAINDLSTIGGIAPLTSIRLFVQVFAPAGAPLGQVNVTTFDASTSNLGYVSIAPPIVTATDNSTVINGQVTVLKEQVLDNTCDGVADGAYTTVNLTQVPGNCLRYRLTITNVGTSSVTNVVVSDATPPFTTYSATVPAAVVSGAGSVTAAPAAGAAGTITVTIPTLGPGNTTVVEFGVRIDP